MNRSHGETRCGARAAVVLAMVVMGDIGCSSEPPPAKPNAGIKGNPQGKAGGIAGAPAKPKTGGAGGAKPAAASGGGQGGTTQASDGVMSATAGSTSSGGGGTTQVNDGEPNAQAGQGGTSMMTGSGGEAAPAIDPADTAAACMDRAGEYVCDVATLYQCGDMAVVKSKQACTNAKRCQAGIKTGKCGACDPGQFKCEDVDLLECDDTGAWQKSMACATKELCSEKNHSCDPMACAAGAFDCGEGSLRKCADDLTGFEVVGACEPDLCDAKGGQCNECVPNSKTCEGETLVSCSADGKRTATACSGATPFCTQGKCVACKAASDCKPVSDCRVPGCSAGTCTAGSPKQVRTMCSNNFGGRLCDLIGNCVACLDDRDCSPDKRCNLLNVFTPCEARRPLDMATPILSGVFNVTVAPGFSVQLTTDSDELRSELVVRWTAPQFTQECVRWTTGTCTIPTASMARTLSITGPRGSCTSINLENQLRAAPDAVRLNFDAPPIAPADGGMAPPLACDKVLEIKAISG